MLNWANRFNIFCFLDNCGYDFPPHHFECLLAVDAVEWVQAGAGSLQDLDRQIGGKWWFGHLGYELQHSFFGLKKIKEDPVDFPLFYFFNPRIVVYISGGCLHIEGGDGPALYRQIMAAEDSEAGEPANLRLKQRFTRDAYIKTVEQLQQHMQRGDCYELNFCQEFFATSATIDPVRVFKNLTALSPNPFSAFYRLDEKFLVCASPERFLRKEGNRILEQPIKGTARRAEDRQEDERRKEALRSSAKEQAENIMVVDLVRNDLSRICVQGSVRVDELMGLYSFPQVHQLVSTVSGMIRDPAFSEIIRAVFPMGSMTGAPKQSVMELIDRYETAARGIFSGSVGYIHPSGDFDFNVVIRSIMYNQKNRYLSFQVGSGITIYSQAAAEWEECLLKVEAIKKVLGLPAL
jgi:para-aminobenzoate synthetase component I